MMRTVKEDEHADTLGVTSTIRMLAAKLLVAIGLVSLVMSGAPAYAQQIKPLDVERDPNGVDLLKGYAAPRMPSLSIPAAPALTFNKLGDFWPVLEGTVVPQAPDGRINFSINAGGIASDSFSCAEICVGAKGSGGVLFGGGNQGPYYYTQGGSGKKITFDIKTGDQSAPTPGIAYTYVASSVTTPGGETLTFTYDSGSPFPGFNVLSHRPTIVTSSYGYQLRFTYQSNDPTNAYWRILSKAEIVKTSAPTVALASLTYSGSPSTNTITDIDQREYSCTNCDNSLIGPQPGLSGSLKLPGETATSYNVTSTSTSAGHNLSVTNDGVAYSYVVVDDTTYLGEAVDNVTVTGPDGFYRYVEITNINQSGNSSYSSPRSRIDSIKDSQNRTTSYQYDNNQRVTKITYPELNSVEVSYDGSGNITEMRSKAKPGSGQADIVQYAHYNGGLGCSAVTCFLPVWTKDAKGNQTDYTWSSVHGGLLTQLDPANAQGKRRKVKNTYDGIGRLTKEEVCEASSSGTELTCGTANAYVQQFTYWAATHLPLTQTITDGVGTAPLTTTYAYDDAGRQLSMDGPLPGSDDATYARYDVLGRKIWEIGPKGENGKRPATRATYRQADSKPEKIETGTVAGGTPSASAAAVSFIDVISITDTAYNSRRLATETSVSDSTGTKHAVTQMSYDARNREQCSAVRMNSAVWNSLPSSACTLQTAGSEGPDRITKKHYDTESRVTKIEQGLGTSLVRDYATYTFTPNGQMASMTDARGYKASMSYDGFDRQTHWYFPMPGSGQTGAINPNDYEQYTYDANGNRLTLRKRDGSVLSFTYDKLNRVTRKTVPTRAGLNSTHTRDVFYQYDIRGLQTRARFDSLGGHGLFTSYDRYGRVSYNTDNMDGVVRSMFYSYDAAGNRLTLRYPDAKFARYTYSSGGQFNQVKDHGNAVIADYNYNTRGELSQINRDGTAPDQDWTYDPIGRLASTGWSNAGANNVTWSFTRNLANQIKTETQTNDAFSWDDHADVTRPYVTNGLNQYTSVSGNAYCYDDNGNLTRDDTWAYQYDIENRLVEMRKLVAGACPTNTSGYTGTLAAQLRYDPLGRLHEVKKYNSTTGALLDTRVFLYDGDALVAEYNASGTMLNRYVHGPNASADDPIAEYSGSGVAAADRTNLYADARGSIALRTNTSGGNAQINSYDAFGVPDINNAGRFQYTGQVWLEELGMNYYKARMYSPRLGRFMQTDPVGYEDNVNLYGYVANDPINKVDPTGMFECKGNGDGSFTCTAKGKVDAALMYAYVAAVKMGIVGPPDGTLPNSDGSSGSSGGVPASDRQVKRSDNGGPPLDDPPPSFTPPPLPPPPEQIPRPPSTVPDRSSGPVFQTEREARAAASANGWRPVNGMRSRGGAKFYRDKNGNLWTRDRTGHRGGAWKKFDRTGKKRLGTYDRTGTRRIGD